MNNVIMTGRITAEPVLAKGSNSLYCRFSLAVENGYGENKKVIFVHCVAFNKTAEILENFVCKGDKMLIQGYIDADEHEKTWYTTIIVNQIELLGNKRHEEVAEEKPKTVNKKKYY